VNDIDFGAAGKELLSSFRHTSSSMVEDISIKVEIIILEVFKFR